MPFALRVLEALELRKRYVANEFVDGDALRDVLNRDLRAVEAAAGINMLTSVLLLEGSQLRHAAAPSLPASYCEAIDGAEIGSRAGSCGTAAFLGCPIYVKDIATDDLWVDYRALAHKHSLRACWSTPFFDSHGTVIGTFAIYHLEPRSPTPEELAAIDTITNHVAWAVMQSKSAEAFTGGKELPSKLPLDLPLEKSFSRKENITSLGGKGAGRFAGDEDAQIGIAGTMQMMGDNFEALAAAIDRSIVALMRHEPENPGIVRLRRARSAAKMGAALVRGRPSSGSIH